MNEEITQLSTEEIIQQAKLERQQKLQQIKKQLGSGSEDEEAYDIIIKASELGKQKLREAADKKDFVVYNSWIKDFRDSLNDDRGFPLKKFQHVEELFSSEEIPLLDYIGINLANAKLNWYPNDEWSHGFDGRSADFTGANFENAKLVGFLTNPINRFHHCNFKRADLSNPPDDLYDPGDMCMGRLEAGEFAGSDFSRANLSYQMLNSIEANDCKFTGTNFSHTRDMSGNFKNADFSAADLSHTDPASWSFSSQENVKIDDNTKLTGAKIRGDIEKLDSQFRLQWEKANPSAAAALKRDKSRQGSKEKGGI